MARSTSVILVAVLFLICGCSNEPATSVARPDDVRSTDDPVAQAETDPPAQPETPPTVAATDPPPNDTEPVEQPTESEPEQATATPFVLTEEMETTIAKLEKIDVYSTIDAEAGQMEFDTSYTKDLPQALALLAELPHVSALELGESATDEHLAQLPPLPELTKLEITFNENVTDAGLEHIAKLISLTHLNLLYCQAVTREGLPHLAGLTNLQFLNLGNLPVGDGGTAHLQGLTKLEHLELSDCDLADEDLAPLAELSELRVLKIDDNDRLTSVGIKLLAGLTQLQQLALNSTETDDEGLQHLANLTELEALDLSFTNITDAGLAHLADMRRMRSLDIDRTNIYGTGLKHLAGMTKLSHLELGGNVAFTGEGLEHLAGCPELTEINLSWTGVNNAGLAKIKALKQLKKLDVPPYGHASSLGGPFWRDGHPERFSDEGLKHIGEMTNLEWLWIGGSGITDDGLAHLASLTNLTYLGFGDLPNIQGPGLAHLKPLQKLDGLYLKDTGVTDDGLQHAIGLTQIKTLQLPDSAGDAALKQVQEMKHLETLYTSGGFSPDALTSLKEALPELEID